MEEVTLDIVRVAWSAEPVRDPRWPHDRHGRSFIEGPGVVYVVSNGRHSKVGSTRRVHPSGNLPGVDNLKYNPRFGWDAIDKRYRSGPRIPRITAAFIVARCRELERQLHARLGGGHRPNEGGEWYDGDVTTAVIAHARELGCDTAIKPTPLCQPLRLLDA